MKNVRIKCESCGKEFTFPVPVDGFFDWFNDEELIQLAMPELTPEQRELLISQNCGDCWDEKYADMLDS